MANVPVDTISINTPIKTKISPHRFRLFHFLKLSTEGNLSFSARVSNKSPIKINAPPTQAANPIQTSHANQVSDGDNTTDAMVILFMVIPYAVLTIVFIVVMIPIRDHYRKNPI